MKNYILMSSDSEDSTSFVRSAKKIHKMKTKPVEDTEDYKRKKKLNKKDYSKERETKKGEYNYE